MRADVNVSVRKPGEEGYRPRWELKNMNSFTFIGRGIEAAVREQIAAYERGETIEQSTYDYDPDTDRLTVHRSKEEADDYRYFPEPDLVPVEPPDGARRAAARRGARVCRARASAALEQAVGFDVAYALVTTERDALYVGLGGGGRRAARSRANWVMNDFAATGDDPAAVDVAGMATVLKTPGPHARRAHRSDRRECAARLLRCGLHGAESRSATSPSSSPVIDAVLAANPAQVETYRGGKEGVLGFLVGQVMKETQGKADAKVVNGLLREKLRSS